MLFLSLIVDYWLRLDFWDCHFKCPASPSPQAYHDAIWILGSRAAYENLVPQWYYVRTTVTSSLNSGPRCVGTPSDNDSLCSNDYVRTCQCWYCNFETICFRFSTWSMYSQACGSVNFVFFCLSFLLIHSQTENQRKHHWYTFVRKRACRSNIECCNGTWCRFSPCTYRIDSWVN